MSKWKKCHPKYAESQSSNSANSSEITDLWYKNSDKSIGTIAVIRWDNEYEVRRMVKVQTKLDTIKNISGLSFEWNNGRPVVKLGVKGEMDIGEGRILGRFDTKDDALSKAEEYMSSN